MYEGFRPFLPLIVALRSPYLKMRHWVNIINLGKPPLEIEIDLHQSLETLVEMGIMDLIDEINEIAHFAARERKLEE